MFLQCFPVMPYSREALFPASSASGIPKKYPLFPWGMEHVEALTKREIVFRNICNARMFPQCLPGLPYGKYSFQNQNMCLQCSRNIFCFWKQQKQCLPYGKTKYWRNMRPLQMFLETWLRVFPGSNSSHCPSSSVSCSSSCTQEVKLQRIVKTVEWRNWSCMQMSGPRRTWVTLEEKVPDPTKAISSDLLFFDVNILKHVISKVFNACNGKIASLTYL